MKDVKVLEALVRNFNICYSCSDKLAQAKPTSENGKNRKFRASKFFE